MDTPVKRRPLRSSLLRFWQLSKRLRGKRSMLCIETWLINRDRRHFCEFVPGKGCQGLEVEFGEFGQEFGDNSRVEGYG